MQNMSGGKSALGLDGNVTALIGYLIGIIAIVLIFIEKDNRFVRFHAIQSVVFHIGAFVLIFAVWIVGGIIAAVLGQISSIFSIIGILIYLLGMLLWLGWLGGMIYGAIKAFQGQMFKYPIFGNLAEKWAN
jgi:uncharacterized membrane protein